MTDGELQIFRVMAFQF